VPRESVTTCEKRRLSDIARRPRSSDSSRARRSFEKFYNQYRSKKTLRARHTPSVRTRRRRDRDDDTPRATTEDARAMNANDAMQVRSKSAARDGESDTPRARRFDFLTFELSRAR